jgi:hypothetical protein
MDNFKYECFIINAYNFVMLSKSLCLLLLSYLAASNPNYQERVIYINKDDNVCYFGANSDTIRLNINIDGKNILTSTFSGRTSCSYWTMSYAGMIRASNHAEYLDSMGTDIKFVHETTRSFSEGELIQIIQRLTVVNPVKINGDPFTCMILGDGKLQHFGIELD